MNPRKLFQRIAAALAFFVLVLAFSLISLREARGEGNEATKEGGMFVFSRYFGPNPGTKSVDSKLFVIDLKSKSEKQITFGPGQDIFATWSPDGKRIVFSSNRENDDKRSRAFLKLFVINADGSGLVSLDVLGVQPTWSPDGRWIAFFSGNGVFMISPDGTNKKLVFRGRDISDFGPVWSPDSRSVSFIPSGGDVAVVDVYSLAHRIGNRFEYFSPDGKSFMFKEMLGDNTLVFVGDIGKNNVKLIYNFEPKFYVSRLSWTCDNRIFVVVSGFNIMNRDGTGFRTFLTDFELGPKFGGDLFGVVPSLRESVPTDPPMSVFPQGKLPITWGAIKSQSR